MKSSFIPICIIQSEREARTGVLMIATDELHNLDIERLKTAHRALRSLPPDLMFIRYDGKTQPA
jgi:hypothetical protein